MTKKDILEKILNTNISGDIARYSINSQELSENDIFIAIRNGNKYVNDAINKSAIVIMDNVEDYEKLENKERVYLVKDSIITLQDIAREYRKILNAKVIAITGSNGKTTVKDISYSLLKDKYKVDRTKGNYNNHIGLPLTIVNADISIEYLILELGMSDIGEIALLAEIAKPDISIITNIGDSHIEFLKTKDNVFKAKTEIIPFTRDKIIVNGDDDYLGTIEDDKVYAIYKEVDYDDVRIIDNGTAFTHELMPYFTNLYGEHNVSNIILVIKALEYLDISLSEVEDKLDKIEITGQRFEKIEKNGIVYINDAYNSSPLSLANSLYTFSELYNDSYKVIVLGDMLELGDKEIEYHEGIAKVLEKIEYDDIYLYGSRMKYLHNKLNKGYYLDNKEDIVREIRNKKEKYDNIVVFLKASRGMKLETIITD